MKTPSPLLCSFIAIAVATAGLILMTSSGDSLNRPSRTGDSEPVSIVSSPEDSETRRSRQLSAPAIEEPRLDNHLDQLTDPCALVVDVNGESAADIDLDVSWYRSGARESRRLRTDRDGRAVLAGKVPRFVRLRAVRPVTVDPAIEWDTARDIEYVLAQTRRVMARVLDRVRRVPITTASIAVHPSGENVTIAVVPVDDQGAVSLDIATGCPIDLVASATGYRTASCPIAFANKPVSSQSPYEVELRLDRQEVGGSRLCVLVDPTRQAPMDARWIAHVDWMTEPVDVTRRGEQLLIDVDDRARRGVHVMVIVAESIGVGGIVAFDTGALRHQSAVPIMPLLPIDHLRCRLVSPSHQPFAASAVVDWTLAIAWETSPPLADLRARAGSPIPAFVRSERGDAMTRGLWLPAAWRSVTVEAVVAGGAYGGAVATGEGVRRDPQREVTIDVTIGEATELVLNVTDEGGTPIGGATIGAWESISGGRRIPSERGFSETRTDARGVAVLHFRSEMIDLEVSAPGRTAMRLESVSTNAGELDVALGDGGEVSGRVIDWRGEPVAGVTVRADCYSEVSAHEEDGPIRHSRDYSHGWARQGDRLLKPELSRASTQRGEGGVTRTDGTFTVSGLPPRGVAQLTIADRGYIQPDQPLIPIGSREAMVRLVPTFPVIIDTSTLAADFSDAVTVEIQVIESEDPDLRQVGTFTRNVDVETRSAQFDFAPGRYQVTLRVAGGSDRVIREVIVDGEPVMLRIGS